MKLLFAIILLTNLAVAKAQKEYAGSYTQAFQTLIIKNDSTFRYSYRTHIRTSWNVGTWRVNNDTIYFKVVPVMDTLYYTNASKVKLWYELVLSDDDKNDVSTTIIIKPNDKFNLQTINSGPTLLYFKRNKLFYIIQGKLLLGKTQHYLLRRKLKNWFVKK